MPPVAHPSVPSRQETGRPSFRLRPWPPAPKVGRRTLMDQAQHSLYAAHASLSARLGAEVDCAHRVLGIGQGDDELQPLDLMPLYSSGEALRND